MLKVIAAFMCSLAIQAEGDYFFMIRNRLLACLAKMCFELAEGQLDWIQVIRVLVINSAGGIMFRIWEGEAPAEPFVFGVASIPTWARPCRSPRELECRDTRTDCPLGKPEV